MANLRQTTLNLKIKNGNNGVNTSVSGTSICSSNGTVTIGGIYVDNDGCYYDFEGNPIKISVDNNGITIKYCSKPVKFVGGK